MANPKYAFLFGLLGLGAGLAAWDSRDLARFSNAWAALSCGLLAAAFSLNRPGWLLKRPGGTLSPASWALFGPYHALNGLLLRAVRLATRENAFDEVAPGLFLGGRLLFRDAEPLERANIGAVLDLAAEFPEPAFVRRGRDYRLIALLDASAPSPEVLREGAAWLSERRQKGGVVYVHCASGHGRSALFAAAALVASGEAPGPDEALAMIARKRPGIGLKRSQLKALEAFASTSANPSSARST